MKILLTSAALMVVLTLHAQGSTGFGQLTVHSWANIYGAASTNIHQAGYTPPAPGGGGGGVWPSSLTSSAPLGYVVLFTNVAGSISLSSSLGVLNNADGNTSFSTDITSFGASPGFGATHLDFWPEFFLAPTRQRDPAPPTLDFGASGLGTSFTSLSPLIGQLFFIGDGRTGTGSGAIQQFFIPPTATGIYLGFADALNYAGLPGQYQDNVGFLTANFRIESVPEPATWTLFSLGSILLYALRHHAGRRSGRS